MLTFMTLITLQTVNGNNVFASQILGSPLPAEWNGLTPDELKIYQRGKISDEQVLWGGVVGTLVGYGVGHAVIGEYSHKGWIFTVGEGVGAVVMITAIFSELVDCVDNPGVKCFSHSYSSTWAVAGATLYFGFRIWEIVDIWTFPPAHNKRYKAVQEKLGFQKSISDFKIAPLVTADIHPAFGVQVGFKF